MKSWPDGFFAQSLPTVPFSQSESGGSDSKESAYKVGDLGLIPGLGRFPGEENGHPLQYSSLGNPMDRGAWQATVHGVAKNQTRLSTHTHLRSYSYDISEDGDPGCKVIWLSPVEKVL